MSFFFTDEQIERSPPELGDIDAHGRQRRRDVSADGNVIESGEGDVLRHAKSCFAERTERTDGGRCSERVGLEQLPCDRWPSRGSPLSQSG